MKPCDVSGFVLAGGKSSRMGRDKALLELAGRPLIVLAIEKLTQLCHEVHILSSRTELETYAPLIGDVHPGCGPLGGVEAALLHASCTWSLILPVDMPFLQMDFLKAWLERVGEATGAYVALFTIGDRPQPTLCMLHRDVTPFVQQALQNGKYKLYPVLEAAARKLATTRNLTLDEVFLHEAVAEGGMFSNLNTPEEFADAERWYAHQVEATESQVHHKRYRTESG